MKYVSLPNLPKKANGVILSPQTPDSVVYALENLKIKIFSGCVLNQPVAEISAHPDINILHIKDNMFITSPVSYSYYEDLFKKYKINLIKGSTSGIGNYPLDVAYNVAWVSNRVFHNFKYTDEKVLENTYGIKINVNQGYAKCSVCIVDLSSIITDDVSIATAAIANNIDVLLISKGSIRLGKLNYGFIGGASGKLSKKVLAFAGDITKHSDYNKIKEFCLQRKIEILPLGNDKLCDIGSILPIFEEV